MDVIIVSKTHMSNAACVGGVLANGRFVRLLDSHGYNQDSDTELEVGDVYTITFSERQDKRSPHVEDILVTKMEYAFTFSSIDKMVEYLTDKLKVNTWEGSTEVLFEGKLQWTSGGSGYISANGEIPDNSVGFWIPDKPLSRNDFKGKVRYRYPLLKKSVSVEGLGSILGKGEWRNISYVGFQIPVKTIPAGTLLRVSLARWWSPNEDEERCYLQLSGWYGLPEPEETDENEDDNMPF